MDYFTFAKTDGKTARFNEPVNYWLELNNEMLTLHFFLPLSTPVKAANLDVEVYDPEFFIDFELAEADPVKLAGAPTACKLVLTRPPDPSAPLQSQRLSEAMLNQQTNYGAMFATTAGPARRPTPRNSAEHTPTGSITGSVRRPPGRLPRFRTRRR